MANRRKQAPARTPEARENQLISLAVDLAEEQLRNGTASAQVITHYLKLASTKERLEREKMKEEITLLKAKASALETAKNIEELYSKALEAMKGYRVESSDDYDEDVQ